MTRVLLALHRLGPYHLARLRALPPLLDVAVLETRAASQEYLWPEEVAGLRHRFQLRGARDPECDPPQPLLDLQLTAVLQQCAPEVVACVGWADPAYQRLQAICHRLRVPLVIVSDSRQRDHARSATKEWLKRQLLRGYAAALVAGRESRAYLELLGFPAAAIFQPWDVVDANFFAQAEQFRTSYPSTRSHFLCVGRFIPEKNHTALLQAFGLYQQEGGGWDLLLVGGGPLEGAIKAQLVSLPEPARCFMQHFLDPQALLRCYARAAALILPSVKDTWGLVVNEAMAAGLPCLVSSSCGCAVDLVDHETTGWRFDPDNPKALAALMHIAERQSLETRQAMVAAARRRVQAFSPEAFSTGFQAAVAHALKQPRFSWRAALTARLISRWA